MKSLCQVVGIQLPLGPGSSTQTQEVPAVLKLCRGAVSTGRSCVTLLHPWSDEVTQYSLRQLQTAAHWLCVSSRVTPGERTTRLAWRPLRASYGRCVECDVLQAIYDRYNAS